MKIGKLVILICFQILINHSIAQVVTNLIFVGPKGVTENVKEAENFILVKKYPNGSFERKDYKLYGPLKQMKTYSDSSLKILHGIYCSYSSNGNLQTLGHYLNNKKDGNWLKYDQNGKTQLQEKYVSDSLIESKIPDTTSKKKEPLKPGEIEAEFVGGQAALVKFLIKNLNGNISQQSVNGGKVSIGFTINTVGNVCDFYLKKSVEFILDEEALRVLNKMPKWNPAEQDGKKVNAYRIQPITFELVR